MLRRKLFTMGMAVAMTLLMSMTALAGMGSWQKNDTGWWWQGSGGGYPTNKWVWIDGDLNGSAECYYFDSNGYLLTNTTAPDGYQVNVDGAWTVNGAVQAVTTHPEIHEVGTADTGTTVVPMSGQEPVMDGKSVAQITLNTELSDLIGKVNSLDFFTDKEAISDGRWGPTYSAWYRSTQIKVESETVDGYNTIGGIIAPASIIFNNIPEQGIEMNAFFDNFGYESPSVGRRVMASTGGMDSRFELPTGSYRTAWSKVGRRDLTILLTEGSDHKWYIYPDSRTWLK